MRVIDDIVFSSYVNSNEKFAFLVDLKNKANKCKSKNQKKKLLSEIERLLSNPIYHSKSFQYSLRYVKYLTYFELGYYSKLADNLKIENVDVMRYYIVFKFKMIAFILFSLLLTVVQILLLKYTFSSTIENPYFILVYVPLILSSVYCEFGTYNIMKAFNGLYNDVLFDNLILDNQKSKYKYLISLFYTKVFKLAKLDNKRLINDAKLWGYLFFGMAVIYSIFSNFDSTSLSRLLQGILGLFLMLSILRAKVGHIPASFSNDIEIQNIDINEYAEDGFGGFRNLYTIQGFYLLNSFVFFICFIGCIFFVWKFQNEYKLVFMIMCGLISSIYFKRLYDTLKISISLNKKVKSIIADKINIIKNKAKARNLQDEDSFEYSLIRKINFASWTNFRKFLSIILGLLTIVLNIVLALYPEFFKQLINDIFNFF